MPKTFEYRHIVSFEETNVVGNVYYVALLSWQGRCREMFLRDNVPQILSLFDKGLALATTRVSCDFRSEIYAFDEIAIRMTLKSFVQNRIAMAFEYWRTRSEGDELVANGEQEIACMRRTGGGMVPAQIPAEFAASLVDYL